MEKKLILVGMRKNATTQLFFNRVLEQLIRYEIDITDVDRYRLRFETPHAKVWFVDDYYAKYFLDGILPDAIFGEQYPELLDRARDDTIISIRDRIGLVDYINEVERYAPYPWRPYPVNGYVDTDSVQEKRVSDTYIGDMWPKSIYISTAEENYEFYKLFLNSAYGRQNGKTQACIEYMKKLIERGELTMAQAENIYIRQDIKGAAELAATMQELRDRMKARQKKLPGIKNVIFSGPCTIVLWEDGTKTVVRCEKDVLDPEKGLAMAIAKKALGTNKSGSNYYDIFKKWLPKEEEPMVLDYATEAKEWPVEEVDASCQG